MEAAAGAATRGYFELTAASTSTAATAAKLFSHPSNLSSADSYYSTVLLPSADNITSLYSHGAVETTTGAITTVLDGFTSTSAGDVVDPPFVMSWSASETAEVVYLVLLSIIGTPINVIALVNFSRSSKSINSEMRLMRLSRQLLIAHIMVLCFYSLWRTYWIYTLTWTQGDFLCKIYSFFTALPFHLWSNLVAAIAADMLYCIKMPLRSVHNGSKRVSWLIGICWVSAIICAAPMMVLRGTVVIPGTNDEQCYPLVGVFDDYTLLIFNIFHIATVFYVPLIIIVVCYVSIWITLRTQMTERRLLGDDKRRSNSINSRFLTGTATIMCAFVLTWMPYQVMALLGVFCEQGSKCHEIMAYLVWLEGLLLASTCINPFIYKFGIFQTMRRPASSGYYTYHTHSQVGVESNANGKSSASGFRSDFRQSMRSLGPHGGTNGVATHASSGALNVSNKASVRLPRLISRLSANAITNSVEKAHQPVAPCRKFRSMYRTGESVSANSPPSTRCQNKISAAPTSSASAQPLLALAAKVDEKAADISIASTIKPSHLVEQLKNDVIPSAKSDPCLNQSATQNSLNSLSLLEVNGDAVNSTKYQQNRQTAKFQNSRINAAVNDDKINNNKSESVVYQPSNGILRSPLPSRAISFSGSQQSVVAKATKM